MQKLFSTMLQLPVISFQAEGDIASCEGILFDPKELMGSLLHVRSNELFNRKDFFIVWTDILEVSNGIYVQDKGVLLEKGELLRHQNVIERNCVLIDMNVETQSGDALGNIYDYSFDMDSGDLIKIYVRNSTLFTTKNLLIAKTQIVAMKEKTIVVEDGILYDMQTKKSMHNVKKLRAKASLSTKE